MQKRILTYVLHSIVIFLGLVMSPFVFADCSGWFSFGSCEVKPPICNDNSCSLSGGVEAVGNAVSGFVTKKTLTAYVQDIIVYLLGFISLIGVIYIMYAGFQVMTGAGDEEKLKKARNIIIYVILGIVLMWIAYSLVNWSINFVNGK
ncbi:MAG: hypothetical protein PHY14_03570 [Candidatus Gracilibacteria bacterium]|nr:hypothetical protein [Candidatus Gracilibacteria bacterium]